MFKLLKIIFKWFIVGTEDLELCFDLTVSFDKALEYLRKGYIVYDWSENTDMKKLFIMIDNEIYVINRNASSKSEKVQCFASAAMINHRWKIIPFGGQVELFKTKDEE